MKIIETDNRSETARRADAARRDSRARLVTDDERRRIWERGFVAAMELVAASAEAPALARGTREWEDAPTAPYPIIDLDLVNAE